MTYPVPVCFDCKNLLHEFGLKCKAFPNGIPDEILQGDNPHTTPIINQGNDIVFEPLPTAD